MHAYSYMILQIILCGFNSLNEEVALNISTERPWIELNFNNASAKEQQEIGKADMLPSPGMASVSATLQVKTVMI